MTSTHTSNKVFSTLELVHSLPPQQMGPGHTAHLLHFQSPPMRVNSENQKETGSVLKVVENHVKTTFVHCLQNIILSVCYDSYTDASMHA